MTRLSVSFLLATVFVLLAGCSDITCGTGSGSTTCATTTTAPVAGVIALGTSTNFILTDNATAATLTATLVDSSNAVMAGVAVSFSTTTGNLSASTVTTDANGVATVTLKSGLFDLTNRTANVTASVGAQSASVPILIKGSTLTLALSPSNSIQAGAGTITATATATDAATLGRPNQTIRFSIGAASTGSATLSVATLPPVTVPPATCNLTQVATCNLTTDPSGVATPLTFTPTAEGTVVLTAEWLDSAGAVTVTATQNIVVTVASGTAFAIVTPPTNPTALATFPSVSPLSTQPIAVTVPANIAGVNVDKVRISATSGTWVGSDTVTVPNTGTSILQTPSASAVAAIYTAPTYSGSVTVQVDALDASGATLSSLTRTFAISAPSSAAAKLFLAPSVSTIVPSSGTNISTATLAVSVLDANNNAVGGAAVMFGLLGTTGSGESVSLAVVITDSHGHASTTFSAGTSPTLAAIYAQAKIAGQVCTFSPSPLTAETNTLCDAAPMIVASTAVSVTIGFGSTISDTANATQYLLPGSVLVVNSNNSPVAGVPVTLTAFPIEYRNGIILSGKVWNGTSWLWECLGPFNTSVLPTWDPLNNVWVYTTPTSFTAAEDANRNGILDPGEDTPAVQTASQITAQAISLNKQLSPQQAAGGAVPLTVTTDSNGAATFMLQYPKASARFIKDELTARVIVAGTESSAKMTEELPMSMADDLAATCPVGHESSF